MLAFDLTTIPQIQKGVGVQLIKIKDKDNLIDITDINPEDGFEWTSGSKKRKIDTIDFWVGKRAQSGKKVPKFFNKVLKFSE